VGAPDFSRCPLADKFLYRALVCVNAYKCAKFQLPSSITFRDKEGVPKFNVGLLAPCHTRTLKLLRVLKVLGKVKQHAKFQHRIYASCSYAVMYFPLAFHYMCPKMGFLGVKMWKYCLLTPKRHYNAWIRVCWCIACQNRFNGLSSRSVEKFCIYKIKKFFKNWVVILAIWGEVTSGATLTKCGMFGDIVDVITCAIFGYCRLKCAGVVRG